MEIERKYLITTPPDDYKAYPCHHIQQAYLCTQPVVRIRKEGQTYYLTYKSKGLMIREEYNLPLTKEAYEHLLSKADGQVLSKVRYLLPIQNNPGLTIELDIFEGALQGLMLAEVEFESQEAAEEFIPPAWFGEDVTFSHTYHNSNLAVEQPHHKKEHQ